MRRLVNTSLPVMAAIMDRVFVCSVICLMFYGVCCVNSQLKATTLTEDNWRDILEGEWMVEFMAPWCPACRQFTDTWNSLAKQSRDLEVQIGVVDVTENPGLSGRFLVTALPSIYHVKDGIFRQYMGGRKEIELVSFLDEDKWQSVEPVSKWTAPDSIQMGIVSQFFKLAMRIRAFYDLMTTEYGIPEWGCYLIFAVITIVLGLLLGLLLVCFCDFVLPSKQVPPPLPPQPAYPDEDKDGDIIDDTTEDGNTTTVRKRHLKTTNDDDTEEKKEDKEEK